MKRFMSIIIIAALLTSCAKAPDEVIKENEVLNSAESIQSEVSLEYASLDEIRARIDTDRLDNSSNVILNNVRVGTGEKMPVYDTIREFPSYMEIEVPVKDIFNDEFSLDSSRTIKENFGTGDNYGMIFYVPEGKGQECGVSSSYYGSMSIVYDFDIDHAMPNPNAGDELVKTYMISLGDDPKNDSYTMADQNKLKICDAIKEGERLFNTYFLKPHGNDITLKVSRLDVYKYSDDSYGYAYYVDAYDNNGNLLIGNTNPVNNIEDFDKQNSNFIFDRKAYGYFNDSKMHPHLYTNLTPSEGNISENGDKLITLKCALNILSGRLASSAMYEYDDVSLSYLTVIPPVDGSVTEDEYGNKTIFDDLSFYMNNSNTIQLRPYWVFRNSDKNSPEYSVNEGMVIVDALTGELYIY